MNAYYDKLKEFRSLLIPYVEQLFNWYGNKLMLRLEDYNLLRRKGNCIESSTAIGFVLEEFIVSKLEEFSKAGKSKGFTLHSYTDGTTTRSSDCYVLFEDIKILINVKVEKAGSTNDAVAAINQLAEDYSSEGAEEGKLAYLILKIGYDFTDDDLYRRISIAREPEIRYLEEFDFSQGHCQDDRKWSEKNTAKTKKGNNGRLQLKKTFIANHKMPEESISNGLTKKQLLKLNTKKGTDKSYIMPKSCCPMKS